MHPYELDIFLTISQCLHLCSPIIVKVAVIQMVKKTQRAEEAEEFPSHHIHLKKVGLTHRSKHRICTKRCLCRNVFFVVIFLLNSGSLPEEVCALWNRERCVPLTLVDYNSTGGSNKEVEKDSVKKRDCYSCLKRGSEDMKLSGKEELRSLSSRTGIQGCPSIESPNLGLVDTNPTGDIQARDCKERRTSFEGNFSVLLLRKT